MYPVCTPDGALGVTSAITYGQILSIYWLIFGAGDGNRTRMTSLEGSTSGLSLHSPLLDMGQ